MVDWYALFVFLSLQPCRKSQWSILTFVGGCFPDKQQAKHNRLIDWFKTTTKFQHAAWGRSIMYEDKRHHNDDGIFVFIFIVIIFCMKYCGIVVLLIVMI